MRDTRIVGEFGEYYTATCFVNSLDIEAVDIIDSNGIDLMCYPKDKSKQPYGVSVKTRNVAKGENNSIRLGRNDVEYCFSETRRRNSNAIPVFSFVVIEKDAIDILIVTHEGVLKSRGYNGIEDFDKENLSINISKSVRETWINSFDRDSVILNKTLRLSE